MFLAPWTCLSSKDVIPHKIKSVPIIRDPSLTPALSSEVFDNPLLLEKILNFVIFNGENLCRKDIKNCRLVNMNWLQNTSANLLKLGLPVFSVTSRMEEGELARFRVTWGASSEAGNPILPFSLTVLPSSKISEDALSQFVNFMLGHGQRVTNMDIQWIGNKLKRHGKDLKLPATSAHIRHPNLKTLKVELPGNDDTTAALLLQRIFAGIEQLDTLILTCIFLPDSWQNLSKFPCAHVLLTLRKLHINIAFLSVEQLELLLMTATLPNLSEIQFNFIPLDNEGWGELIFKILSRYRLQLKKFYIGGHNDYLPGGVVKMKFPVMPKLQYLFVNHSRYIPTAHLSELEQCLPALIEITLLSETVSALLNWMRNSQLDSVKKVSLKVDDRCLETGIGFPMIQQLRTTFPQVVDLTVEMYGLSSSSVLQAIFQEMQQLKKLNVRLGTPEALTDSNYWDTIFLGVSPGLVSGLQPISHLGDAVQVELDERKEPSIVNLSELNTLKVRSYYSTHSNISEVTFQFGLLCMPNLHQVEYDFPLKLSDELKLKWKAQGRKLNKC